MKPMTYYICTLMNIKFDFKMLLNGTNSTRAEVAHYTHYTANTAIRLNIHKRRRR